MKLYKYDESDPLPLEDYNIQLVDDAEFYGCVIYGKKIIINNNRSIPLARKLVTLIHEALHVVNPGYSHGALHHLACLIFSLPNATSEEISLMSKITITQARLNLIRDFLRSDKIINVIKRLRDTR